MYTIERTKELYKNELSDHKNSWQQSYEDELSGKSASTISKTQLDLVLNKLENFEEEFAKMVKQEAESFVEGTVRAVRFGTGDLDAFIAGNANNMSFVGRRDDGTFTRLGFDSSDKIVLDFVKYVRSVQGYVAQEEINQFIQSIGSNFNCNFDFEQRIR